MSRTEAAKRVAAVANDLGVAWRGFSRVAGIVAAAVADDTEIKKE